MTEDTVMQEDDKFLYASIDELLSRCVHAYKEDRMDDYIECRAELLGRIHKAQEAQRLLSGVLL